MGQIVLCRICCFHKKQAFLLRVPCVFGYMTRVFLFQNNLKNLNPSYKMDLDFGIGFWGKNDLTQLHSELHRVLAVLSAIGLKQN